jgi:heavy metal translocating P-type ATPase
MRVHFCKENMTIEEADKADAYLKSISGIDDVTVYERTCDLIIYYSFDRSELIEILAHFSFENDEVKNIEIVGTARLVQREYEEKLIMTIALRYFRKIFYPLPLRIALAYIKSIKYILKALKSLAKGQLNVSVLDAVAITVSLIRGDFETASSVMFLLKIGEILEEWTHKKSVSDLANTMSLGIEKVWLKNKNDEEVLVSTNKVNVGDKIVLRTSNMIPLDGEVIDGGVTVNQSAITGESVAVNKTVGSRVYAGTVVESGECIIKVTQINGQGKYDRIVKMIEDSEKLKSSLESKASNLADRLVPFSLFGTIFTYAITRNVTKALSILMVDYSCALKLTMPVAVLSAINECSNYNATVKGGKYLEALSKANVIVFDKTGTLTNAQPKVADIITFGNNDKAEMLRLAACLEEHFPHSVANAVVNEAKARGLDHEEQHSKVEYIVAHGISSLVGDEKVVIGSYHFVFEDENCTVPQDERDKFNTIPNEYSHLYMAINRTLVAVICIEDPIKDNVKQTLEDLRANGIDKIVMMTGDSERTAKAVAEKLGIDEYHAEVMPEDKAMFIEKMQTDGNSVIMVGDGINDSPALSKADVGIAISSGAAIAREIADITVSSDDLNSLVTLKEISNLLMARIRSNYRSIISFNTALIVLGVVGVIPPTTSAFLHNVSTLAFTLKSMTKLM